MNACMTVRIYFRQGMHPKGLSWFRRIWSTAFSDELIRRAKKYGIRQVIHFNVSEGYLDGLAIDWNIFEIPLPDHPGCVELTDRKEIIERFIDDQRDFISEATVVIVKEPIVILFTN